jgi:hypothetical protein
MAFNYPIGSQGKPEKKPMAKQSAGPAVAQEEPQGEDGMDSQDPHQVVAEHGPAEEVTVNHDHESGMHSVHSKHGGHEHHSEHASASEAHQHATCLGGECSCGAM